MDDLPEPAPNPSSMQAAARRPLKDSQSVLNVLAIK
jgi:hypothetical protein